MSPVAQKKNTLRPRFNAEYIASLVGESRARVGAVALISRKAGCSFQTDRLVIPPHVAACFKVTEVQIRYGQRVSKIKIADPSRRRQKIRLRPVWVPKGSKITLIVKRRQEGTSEFTAAIIGKAHAPELAS